MITMYCKPNRKKCALPQKVTCQKSAREDKSQKPVEEVKNMILKLDKTINAINDITDQDNRI